MEYSAGMVPNWYVQIAPHYGTMVAVVADAAEPERPPAELYTYGQSL